MYYALVTGLHIEGFKSIKKLDLEVHPGVNLLVGPNASGKTNILEAIYFLRHALIDAAEATPYRPHAPLYWSPLDILHMRDESTQLRLGLRLRLYRGRPGEGEVECLDLSYEATLRLRRPSGHAATR